MLLAFMTARNQYGHRKYLAIDTDAKIYSVQCPRMVPFGIEVKTKDYKELVEKCKFWEFKEVSYIY